jgi:hypothetical protein
VPTYFRKVVDAATFLTLILKYHNVIMTKDNNIYSRLWTDGVWQNEICLCDGLQTGCA